MRPKISIDKYALRVETDKGGVNHFFGDLFAGNPDWHRRVLSSIQEAYEICVKENIDTLSEEEP